MFKKKILILALGFTLFLPIHIIAMSADKLKSVLTKENLESTAHNLKLFNLDNGNYPSFNEGLKALITHSNPKKYSNYVFRLPLDAWGNPFIYIPYKTAEEDAFQLISFGADERYGGEGEDADIVYPPLVEKKVGFFEWLF